MSGHSKWAGIKHKKAVVDARRGKLFAKRLRAIEVAAREGGGKIDANPTLADAVARARDDSIPTDTIERAIKRGTGELEGVTYETLTYEGYAPGGVAVLVEVLTDNRNRAAADVRRVFTRYGSSLAEPGSVSWMFTKRGVVLVPKDAASEDELLDVALQAGAEDLSDQGDAWQVTSAPGDLPRVRAAIEAAGFAVESAQTTMEPSALVGLDREGARAVLRLLDALEELDDVQEVHSNFDVPDDVMAELAG
ncbi:MAG TPA: YebC/PmpR family DNA-binding transcriptional regulator [Actinomycetota bacterium]|nr:YebC/PmpR family DNA-binding transcriptional regulator [Actinomycetota bacterium]